MKGIAFTSRRVYMYIEINDTIKFLSLKFDANNNNSIRNLNLKLNVPV